MKTKFWKVILLVALCAAILPAAAFAAAVRYPTMADVVTDDTNVLSQTVIRDITSYADEVDDETPIQIHVVLIDFLDGLDAQTYADTLFTRWELGENDFLLLGAVGEDSFACASGARVKKDFSDNSARNLLYSSGFSELFKTQQYDAAFGKYFVAFNGVIAKQFDEDIKLGSMFKDYQADAQPKPAQSASSYDNAGSTLWNKAQDYITGNVDKYINYRETNDDHDGRGLTPSGWLVLIVIIGIVFSQSNPARKARQNRRHGCSPLGWIIGGIGLSALLGKRRR